MIADLEEKMSEPDFWDDPAEAQKVTQELSRLKEGIGQYEELQGQFDDLAVLWELGMEEGDQSVCPEVAGGLKRCRIDLEHMELAVMLSGEYDGNNGILTIHAGAGGTEAQDWAQMLLRMYVRWAEKSGYKVETLDFQPGEEAGPLCLASPSSTSKLRLRPS